MELNKEICCIVILFNPEIEKLKSTLLQIRSSNIFTIFIDNFSNNRNEIESLDLNVIYLEENLGVAAAHNIGLKKAIEKNYNFAVLLDQDSELGEEFFLKIYEGFKYIESGIDKKIIALGPLHIDCDSKKYYPIRLKNKSLVDPLSLKERFIKTQYIISSGSIISLEKIWKVGFMNPHYFIDYVDVEWGFRAYSHEFTIYIDKQISLNHSIGSKVEINGKIKNIHSPFRRYYMIRNSIYLFGEKNIPYDYLFKNIYNQIIHSIYLCYFMKNLRFKYFLQTVKGLRDGIVMLFRNF